MRSTLLCVNMLTLASVVDEVLSGNVAPEVKVAPDMAVDGRDPPSGSPSARA